MCFKMQDLVGPDSDLGFRVKAGSAELNPAAHACRVVGSRGV